MIALILLAAMDAAPTVTPTAASTKAPTATASPTPTAGTGQTALVATPTPTPVVRANSDKPRTLADVARERRVGGPHKAGSFSAAESTVGPEPSAADKEDQKSPYKKMTLEKLGEPDHRNVTTTFDAGGKAHVTEQWVYPNGVYVYFRDGVTTAVQK